MNNETIDWKEEITKFLESKGWSEASVADFFTDEKTTQRIEAGLQVGRSLNLLYSSLVYSVFFSEQVKLLRDDAEEINSEVLRYIHREAHDLTTQNILSIIKKHRGGTTHEQ